MAMSDEPAAKRLRAGLTERQQHHLTDQQLDLLTKGRDDVVVFNEDEVQRWVEAALLASVHTSDMVSKVVAIFKEQAVTGASLVGLTLEELLASPYKLLGGPAKALAERIARLRGSTAPSHGRKRRRPRGAPGALTPLETFLEALKQQGNDVALAVLQPFWVDDEKEYCSPWKVKKTWKKYEWGKILVEALRQINFESLEPRAARCLRLHAGTGTGKTHSLLEAPSAMQEYLAEEAKKRGEEPPPVQQMVYITYNQNQALAMDRDEDSAKAAVILRVLLRLKGFSNNTCDRVLSNQHARHPLGPGHEQAALDMLVAHCAEGLPLFIGVDECRKLGCCANLMSSALGELAKRLWVQKKVYCTVLMAALTEDTFSSVSERDILAIQRPDPSDDAHRFVLSVERPDASEQERAMIKAAAGNHFRSIVQACKEVATATTVHRLTDKLSERFKRTLHNAEVSAAQDFSKAVVEFGVLRARTKYPAAEQFLDMLGALPPALVCHVFEGEDGFPSFKHPVQKLFQCSAFVTATKQLEHCGMEYDRFRALYGLPVVPHGIVVGNPCEQGSAWFDALRFDKTAAHATDTFDLFEVRNKEVKRTTHKPRDCAYCMPSNGSHPYVDRACIAYHKDSREKCLVIYQDKINKDSFGEAMSKLEQAADSLRKDLEMPVLLVAQVIGASQRTRAQESCRYPYILVRDGEVDSFYTPTFAPALRFLRERHRLG